MLFTPNDVLSYARDRAVRKRDSPMEPAMQARQFNNVLRSLVERVNHIDDERLAEETTISNADLIASTSEIDLTASATRDWLTIAHIDWRNAAGQDYDDQVVLGTIEARHRLTVEWDHLGNPIGYLFDRMRKIKKVSGWEGVFDLRIYGTVLPPSIDFRDSSNDLTAVLDYPSPMFRALQTGYLLAVAASLSPSELELKLWAEEDRFAMLQLDHDSRFHVRDSARVEDIPHLNFDLG